MKWKFIELIIINLFIENNISENKILLVHTFLLFLENLNQNNIVAIFKVPLN